MTPQFFTAKDKEDNADEIDNDDAENENDNDANHDDSATDVEEEILSL